jgi:hypothetical protein
MKKSIAVMPSPIDRNWQAEDDMRTLMAAAKIKADKKRYAAAKAEAKRQLAAITAVKNGE